MILSGTQLDPRIEVVCDECGHSEYFTPDRAKLAETMRERGWVVVPGRVLMCPICTNVEEAQMEALWQEAFEDDDANAIFE